MTAKGARVSVIILNYNGRDYLRNLFVSPFQPLTRAPSNASINRTISTDGAPALFAGNFSETTTQKFP